MEGNELEKKEEGVGTDTQRVRASEKAERKYKFSNKIKYKKPPSLRRKLKKRFNKYKTFALMLMIGVIIIVFLFMAVELAIKQNQENVNMQKQKRIQKILEQEERNKKF
jgi:hypothetical protein